VSCISYLSICQYTPKNKTLIPLQQNALEPQVRNHQVTAGGKIPIQEFEHSGALVTCGELTVQTRNLSCAFITLFFSDI
jgi:hypothetical protein